MLGDTCTTCAPNPCTCGCPEEEEASPCLPKSEECGEWYNLKCMLWMSDPVPGTPIKKYMSGTEIILYLINRIKELEARVTELETP